MKVTFEFDTDKENFDVTELAAVQQAQDLALALWRLDELTRHWRRTEELVRTDNVRDSFNDILEELGINLEKLVR